MGEPGNGQQERAQTAAIHQLANFPSNLQLTHQSVRDPLEPSDGQTFSHDVAAYGIAARTWDASYHLVDYLTGPASCESSHSRLPNLSDTGSPDGTNPTQPSPSPPPPPNAACQTIEFDPASPLLAGSSPRRIHVVDLGSGTCYLPISLAHRLSADEVHLADSISITATDLPAVVPLMERNVSSHQQGLFKVRTAPLSWGDTDEAVRLLKSIDLEDMRLVITCSDLIFFPFLFVPLLRTLLVLTSPHPTCPSYVPIVTIGYKERTAAKEFPFFSLLGRYFLLQPILSRANLTQPWSTHQPGPEIHVIQATRHPSTFDLDLSIISKGDLSQYGQASGSDQWELSLFLKLDF